MLNGAVGYQLLEDGTPTSLGLIFLSSAVLFVGTGYIALDTGFNWTGYWIDSYDAPNRHYALYTLYLLAPLVFIVIFFILETLLVIRILGEKRPMRTFCLCYIARWALVLTLPSLSRRRRPSLRHWTNISIRHQRPPLQFDRPQNQRRPFRDALQPTRRHHDLDFLVKYNGRRLAHARLSK